MPTAATRPLKWEVEKEAPVGPLRGLLALLRFARARARTCTRPVAPAPAPLRWHLQHPLSDLVTRFAVLGQY